MKPRCWLGSVFVALFAFSAFADDIMPRPWRPIREGHELVRLILQTRVGEPYRYRNLSVFPLFSAHASSRGYWTLDQAVSKGILRITEKGDASVPELLAENLSSEPIFLLAGEIVQGGKQNRVLAQDILLPPHSGLIRLEVFCVEQGRWQYQTKQFSAGKDVAHNRLRQQLNEPAVSQSRVWGEVERKSSALGASAGDTRDLSRVYKDESVARNVDAYIRSIRLPRDANGMAVMIGAEVVGVELFGDTETFRSLHDKLLRSYAVDAIEVPTHGNIIGYREQVERFLRRVHDTKLVARQTIGLGRLLEIEGGRLYGTVLVWSEQRGGNGVVHASIFPAGFDIDDEPRTMPAPRPRE